MVVETGNHFAYFYRIQHSFRKDKVATKVTTMSSTQACHLPHHPPSIH